MQLFFLNKRKFITDNVDSFLNVAAQIRCVLLLVDVVRKHSHVHSSSP